MAASSSEENPPVSTVAVMTSAPSSFMSQSTQKVVSSPPENARTILGLFMSVGHP